jgi:RNA polymerase sigma-70 factor, ECF subfamily
MRIGDFLLRPRPEEILREHGPHVRGLLYRLFGPDGDVEDLFQDVFVEVLRALPTFAGRAKLSTWIHRVALNVAYQEMRRRSVRRRVDVVATAESAHVAGDAHAERNQAAQRVHAALACLPPKQRLAVALHDLQGMTLREIADAAGLPLQTVATQVRAGRARLAQVLADLRDDAEHVEREREEVA